MCVCVCVCACVRACVHACMRVCVCVYDAQCAPAREILPVFIDSAIRYTAMQHLESINEILFDNTSIYRYKKTVNDKWFLKETKKKRSHSGLWRLWQEEEIGGYDSESVTPSPQ